MVLATKRLEIAVPQVLMAPMAGASPVALAAAVANAGGMGACGVLGMSPAEIQSWSASIFGPKRSRFATFRAFSAPFRAISTSFWPIFQPISRGNLPMFGGQAFRASSSGPMQLNTWIPDPPCDRDAQQEEALRAFLGRHGPAVAAAAGDAAPVDFDAQVAAMISAGPEVISSIMGVYPVEVVKKMKEKKIRWDVGVGNWLGS